jgi:hypothetical protein
MVKEGTEVIQGLDSLDIVSFIGRKNKKFQAIMLQEMEDILGRDTPEYIAIRKLVLDGFNNYTRSMMRAIFGVDYEYMERRD